MKLRHLIILSLLMGLIIQPQSSGQSKKKTVAVLEFNSSSKVIGKDEISTLSNRFRSILVKTNAFTVLERAKMADILKEQNFVMTDNCNSAECAVQVGQLLGVELIVAGDIGKLGRTYSIDLRMIDVSSGQIVQTETQDHNGEIDGLFAAMAVIGNSFAGIKSNASVSEVNSNSSGMKEDLCYGTFTDPRDGKTYKTIKIGNQVWMAENLNYDAGNGTYCYDGKTSNCNQYGKLYTWEAAKRAVPQGWHLPDKTEFEQLLGYLGGEGAAAYKELTKRECSFNVLFVGWRSSDGNCNHLGSIASLWSASENGTNTAWNLFVYSDIQTTSLDNYFKVSAFSVRCLKD